jgi:hypothetical protein
MPATPSVAAAPANLSPYGVLTPSPIVHETLKPTVTPQASDHSELQSFSGKLHEKLSVRRTFTDVTANPAFAHAPDYSWLVGELRSVGPSIWSVRFASVDEDRDTVILIDTPPMIDLKAGQLVRVEGQLVDPTAHDSRPAYRVNAIRAADQN